MCKCVKELNEKVSKQFGKEGYIVNQDILSGKIYSTFEYQDGKRTKVRLILHSYCPICGKKYDEEEKS